MSDTSPPEPADEIRLSLPAQAVYARVARLAVTGLASRLDFTYHDIEDLRIAVGEVCGILLADDLAGERGARVVLRCLVSADALRVETRREPAGATAEISELSHDILGAVVDEVDIDPEAAIIAIVKRRQG